MAETPNNKLTGLSYNALLELLDRSTVLEGYQAEALAANLRDVHLYNSEPRLQVTHSRALLRRMEASESFEEALILSHVQETVPSFYLSLTLRQLFARGLVVATRKEPNLNVYQRALQRVFELPSFNTCPLLQQCAGELFLDALPTCSKAEEAEALVERMKKLPGLAFSSELQGMLERAQEQAGRAGRDPIIKVDLNQKLRLPIKALGRLFGLKDFRMRVQLQGLRNYEQAVLKVPAFNEESARKAARKFISDFLKSEEGRNNRSARILEVFPPGSPWESGMHPVLNLR